MFRIETPKSSLGEELGLSSWAEIDLDALEHNLKFIQRSLSGDAELMAVIKANAYGHGAVPVAQTVLQEGATSLAVHRIIEGIQLRTANIDAPILILGYTSPTQAKRVVKHDLSPTVIDCDQAQALESEASSQDQIVDVHVSVDTGMGRFGVLPDHILEVLGSIDESDHLRFTGLYTHFATADEVDKSYTYYQYRLYRRVVHRLEENGFSIPLRHVCNSAATVDFPDLHLDMVRCGILLYGMDPSNEPDHSKDLEPVLSLKSRVIRVATLPEGSSIGYGRTYVTPKSTQVALIPVGYGDGYPRLLSNRSEILIHGHRVPVVGAVSMDQIVVNIDDVSRVQKGDEAVLIGQQGEEEISAEEVGQWAETLNYEVVTGLLPRVSRLYLRDGEIIRKENLLQN
ncbi:MAG: alanine racemase [Candidatus Acetothermia bacterium]